MSQQSSRPARGISVVIPCLNEESSIAQAIDMARQGIRQAGLDGEVIVVDNRSTDRSAQIAVEHGARVLREEHPGYGAALRKGFENAQFEIMVMGDADLTYDFTRLGELAQPLIAGEADFVIGNRLRNVQFGAMPWLHRYFGTPLIAFVMRFMFHNKSVHDPNCGMRAITQSGYHALKCVTTGMEFASEMVVQAIRKNLRIAERDIVYRARVGESKLRSFKDGWRHLRFILLYSPTMALLLPGLLVWVLSLLLAAPLAFGPIMIDSRRVDIHFMIMAGLLNIASIQVITIGMLAKAYAHLSGLRDDPVIAWFYRWFKFERVSLFALALIVGGLFVAALIVGRWAAGGFGSLNQARPLFFALLCLVNGVQFGAAGYLFSIMALPRHLDEIPPQARDTGIVDR
jgi:glycosyltransferase involved in cell wall biosynthesis